MRIAAATVEDYLAAVPDQQRPLVSRLRDTVRAAVPEGIEEGMQYGGIGYFVPHRLYPGGYHCDPREPVPFVGIMAQKRHVGLYLFCTYVNPDLTAWFVEEYGKTGKKLDMGKGCVRFKTEADVPFGLVAKVVKRTGVSAFLAIYEASIPPSARKAAATRAK